MANNPKLDFSAMTSGEYVTALNALGLTVSHHAKTQDPRLSAAHVFSISPRQSRRYASGERPIPPHLAAFLRLLVALKYKTTLNGPQPPR